MMVCLPSNYTGVHKFGGHETSTFRNAKSWLIGGQTIEAKIAKCVRISVAHTLIPICRMDMGKLGSGLELSHRRNCGSMSAPGLLKLKGHMHICQKTYHTP